jgi:ribose transport system ATP-binding protein
MQRDVGIALSLEGLTKVFRGQRALDNVDLELNAGEVHALVGLNGSGKTTVIKILAGYHRPASGARAEFFGAPFELGSAQAANAAGMRFIHQDLGLIPALDSVDNLALGHPYGSRWWVSDRQERKRARALFGEFGLDIDPATNVRSLSASHQTMLAIVRALRDDAGSERLLVLDEPTAALPASEVQYLFGLIESLREAGGTILYVTHRLREVFEIADCVTVLRGGRRIATKRVADLTHDSLVELIVGRPIEALKPPEPVTRPGIGIELKSLRGGLVKDVSLSVHNGEIVGVTGLVGSGYEDLPKLAFGAKPRLGGSVLIEGRELMGSPHESVAAGVAFTPADRKTAGGMMGWTLRENITLPRLRATGPMRWLSARRERADAAVWLERLDVRPRDTEAALSALSGGNQQRVVLARWLRLGARAFLLEEPTVGVDMAGRQAVYQALRGVAKEGASVLMTSSEAEEVCAVCDRVVVLVAGRVAAVLEGEEREAERVLSLSLRERRAA